MTKPGRQERPGWRSITPEKPVVFEGQTFTSRRDFAAAYPAFDGDDVIRALTEGCTTVLEVEQHVYARRQAAYKVARSAARRTQAQRLLAASDGRKRKGRKRKA